MSDIRMLSLILASVLLVACAVRKTPPPPNTVESTTPAAPGSTSKPREKSTHSEHDHAPAPAAKSDGLPAHEVGYYMDVLQGRLQQQLDPGVITGRKRDSIVLDFSHRLTFAADSAQLDDAGRNMFAVLAKILAEYRSALASVRVSAEGDDVSARKLAQLRAGTIERILIDDGVAPARVVSSVAGIVRKDGSHVEIVLVTETHGD